jgi:hypothetical protein
MFVAMSREYQKVGASFGGCPALADPDGGCRRAGGHGGGVPRTPCADPDGRPSRASIVRR